MRKETKCDMKDRQTDGQTYRRTRFRQSGRERSKFIPATSFFITVRKPSREKDREKRSNGGRKKIHKYKKEESETKEHLQSIRSWHENQTNLRVGVNNNRLNNVRRV